jgi:3-oxoacyl-[acyl-carrier-protein] synthase II
MVMAFDALRTGDCDHAIVGGSDSLCQLTYSGFNALRAVDPVPCRPFRGDRAGLSLGEGAGFVVLETAPAAAARGAHAICELAGGATTCDAHHMSAPDPDGHGAARAIRQALAGAGIHPDEVAFVNAHGTGTEHNDRSEYRALCQVFGARTAALPLTSTKAIVGHLLGASGALEAVATILCLEAGEVHSTPGSGEVDPELEIDLVRAPRRLATPRVALSTNLAFGGTNTALVFRSLEAL